MKSLFFSFLLFFSSCGYSPILRHTFATNDGGFTLAQADEIPGCTFLFTAHDLCAKMEWTRLPENDPNKEGEFTLRFFSHSAGNPEIGPWLKPDADVSVKLWMPGMNHGSTRVAVTPENEVYRASPIHFVMGGEWEIWVALKKQNTLLEQAKIEVSVND